MLIFKQYIVIVIEVCATLSLTDRTQLTELCCCVLQAVQLALDARECEREMTAVLLRELCPGVISRDAVALGLTRLLSQAEVGD